MSSLTASPTSNPPPSTQDALELLHDDHLRLRALLAEGSRLAFDGASLHAADRSALVSRLGALLVAHERIENEIFFPALADVLDPRDALGDDGEQLARSLAALRSAEADAAGFDQRLARLAEVVDSHITREEERLFPPARALDLQELGIRLALRRGVLLGDQGED